MLFRSDGSHEWAEWAHDDALVWFKITDDYEPPADPTINLLDDSKLIEKHTVYFEGGATGFKSFTYDWVFGDGSSDQDGGKSPSHEYNEPGDYTVELTVKDRFGGVSEKVTRTITIDENNAPSKPSKPSGTTDGKIGNSYSYSTSANENDEDRVWYKWSWGDGEQSEWIGPYNSGETCSASHTWDERDRNLEVKVKAKDAYGGESSWSDPLSVTMPKSKSETNSFISQLLRLPFFKSLFSFLYNFQQ